MTGLLETDRPLLPVIIAWGVVGDTHIHSLPATHSTNKISAISKFTAPTKSRIHSPACSLHMLRGWHHVRVHYVQLDLQYTRILTLTAHPRMSCAYFHVSPSLNPSHFHVPFSDRSETGMEKLSPDCWRQTSHSFQ